MTIQNSYIFLKKEDKNKQNNSQDSIISLLKTAFLINSEDINSDSIFKKMINTSILIKDDLINVIFKYNEVKVINISYLDVIVKYNNKLKAIKCMEYIHNIINGENSDFNKDYICIVSYDSISEYYCNKIYPKLNLFERKLRNLMFNIYIVNFGKEFLDKTIDENLRKDINKKVLNKDKVSTNLKPKDKEELLKTTFYSLDYSDIQRLLFEKRWTCYDEEAKEKFLNSYSDLSTLTDEELRIAYKEVSPKSDWNRFFADKISSESIEADINLVRINRNRVAHCKFFYFEDYQKCNKILNRLIKEVNKAIAVTEQKDFYNKNMEYLRESIRGITEGIGELIKNVTESIKPVGEALLRFSDSCKIIGQVISRSLYNTIEFPKISIPNINFSYEINDSDEDSKDE